MIAQAWKDRDVAESSRLFTFFLRAPWTPANQWGDNDLGARSWIVAGKHEHAYVRVQSSACVSEAASWNIHADTAPWHRLTLAFQNTVVKIGHDVFLTWR